MRALLLRASAASPSFCPSMLASPAWAQDETWLDGDLASWNTPGMAIPAAPTIDGNPDPRCVERERPAETAEDDALIAEGWHLFLPYQRGWGVTLISGLASYDGMCRPLGYQSFVFVDGVFAGTVSPEPMNSRTDRRRDRCEPLVCRSGLRGIPALCAGRPALLCIEDRLRQFHDRRHAGRTGAEPCPTVIALRAARSARRRHQRAVPPGYSRPNAPASASRATAASSKPSSARRSAASAPRDGDGR